jgi:hypothetical protein
MNVSACPTRLLVGDGSLFPYASALPSPLPAAPLTTIKTNAVHIKTFLALLFINGSPDVCMVIMFGRPFF